MYDPSIGRWLEEDPIGFEGDDTNLYRYVGNNPTNYIDPSGEAEKKYLRDNGGKDASKDLKGLDKDHAMKFGNGKLTITVSVDVKVTAEYTFGGEKEERVVPTPYIKISASSTATDRNISDIHFLQLVKQTAVPKEGKKIDMYQGVNTDEGKPKYVYKNGKEYYLDGRKIMPDGKQWIHAGAGLIKGKDGKSIMFIDSPSAIGESNKKSETVSFLTYIFYKNEAIYLVQWEYIGQETDGKWVEAYQNVKGNVTVPLPKALDRPSFRWGYAEVDKEGKLSKPVDIKNWFKK